MSAPEGSTFHPWKRDQEAQVPPPRATSLFSVTRRDSPGAGRYGGASCRPPLRHPPACPAGPAPAGRGGSHPNVPGSGMGRSFQVERGCALVPCRRCSGWGRDGCGRGWPLPRPGGSLLSAAGEQVPCPGPGLCLGARPSASPPVRVFRSSQERGQVPRQQGEEAWGSCCRPPAASGGSAPPPGTPALGTQREVAGPCRRPPAGQGPGSARSPRSAPACSARSRQTALGRPGPGPAPSLPLRPVPSLRGPRLSGSGPVGGRAGPGGWVSGLPGETPQVPQEDLRMRHPCPPSLPGSGPGGSLPKRRSGLQVV